MHSFISISALLTFFFVIVANINVAAAQDKPKNSSPSKCQAQNILDACVKSTKDILASCPVQDWDCLCTHYNNVLTCYNNCPGDPGRFAIESSKVANCNAAKNFGTARASTSAPNPTATKATGTAGDDGNASQTSGRSKPTGTGSESSAPAAESPNAATAMLIGGFEIGMGGLVGLLVTGIGHLM